MASPRDHLRAYRVDIDVACVHCGYNLRGLPTHGNCPECGHPVVDTARLIVRAAVSDSPEGRQVEKERAELLRAAAEGSGYPAEAFELVLAAMAIAANDLPPEQHVSAQDVCDALREYAPLHLGNVRDATLTLAAWKIRRSEDVGRIIYRLVESGRLHASPDDSEADFRGLFTLNTLFDDEDDHGAVSADTLPSTVGIDVDLPCEDCGYNLRGLSRGGRCPECGRGVDDSLRAAEATDESIAYRLQRSAFNAAAKSAGYPVDGVMFVADAFKRAQRRAGRRLWRRNPVDAAAVCRAVREHAATYFNDENEARDLLTEWRVTSGEDVGAIVEALAAHGLIDRRAARDLGGFEGLFSVASPFPAEPTAPAPDP